VAQFGGNAAQRWDMSAGETKILLVDDDVELAGYVAGYLRDNFYDVHVVGDARAADAAMSERKFDLAILDIGLPGEDGLSICRRIVRPGGPCVIMASAQGDEADRIIGLELGADDYLPKPFSPRELLARVKAVLRRRSADDDRQSAVREFRFQGFVFDVARRQLRSPKSSVVLLTSGEAGVLAILARHPSQTMTREELGVDSDAAAEAGRAVDLQVSRLRRKLELHGAGELIKTQPVVLDEASARSVRLRKARHRLLAPAAVAHLAAFLFFAPLAYHWPLTHAACEARNLFGKAVVCIPTPIAVR